MANEIQWQQVCCADHGEYAEARTKGGGFMRLRRLTGADTVEVCRFDKHNRPIDVTDGVPSYVSMPLSKAMEQ